MLNIYAANFQFCLKCIAKFGTQIKIIHIYLIYSQNINKKQCKQLKKNKYNDDEMNLDQKNQELDLE